MQQTCEEHLAILDAISDGDGGQIYVAIDSHVVVAFQKWIARRRARMLDFFDNSPALAEECELTIECIEAADGPAPEFVKDGIRWDSFFASRFDNQYVVFKFFRDQLDGIERQFRKVLFHSPDKEAAWEFKQENVAVEDRPCVRTVYYQQDAA